MPPYQLTFSTKVYKNHFIFDEKDIVSHQIWKQWFSFCEPCRISNSNWTHTKSPSIFDADDEIVFASSWERSITNDPDNFDIWKVVPFKFPLLVYFWEESKIKDVSQSRFLGPRGPLRLPLIPVRCPSVCKLFSFPFLSDSKAHATSPKVHRTLNRINF